MRALKAAVSSRTGWAGGKHAAEVFEALMLLMLLAFPLVSAYGAPGVYPPCDSSPTMDEQLLSRGSVGWHGARARV